MQTLLFHFFAPPVIQSFLERINKRTLHNTCFSSFHILKTLWLKKHLLNHNCQHHHSITKVILWHHSVYFHCWPVFTSSLHVYCPMSTSVVQFQKDPIMTLSKPFTLWPENTWRRLQADFLHHVGGTLKNRNNLLMKLAGSTWGAGANTLRSSALALCYSAAEYCAPLSNPVPWQNWMAVYLGYTLQMNTRFCGWPVTVHDTHTRRRLFGQEAQLSQRLCAASCHCHWIFRSSHSRSLNNGTIRKLAYDFLYA